MSAKSQPHDRLPNLQYVDVTAMAGGVALALTDRGATARIFMLLPLELRGYIFTAADDPADASRATLARQLEASRPLDAARRAEWMERLARTPSGHFRRP